MYIFNRKLGSYGKLIKEDDKHFLVQDNKTRKQCEWLKENCEKLIDKTKMPISM